ncbi:MAG: hypothetical protein methR_P0897 [Methyloprofundus sp.]|nr:MAG: hypothetical protein methR_P0897 [Methyloprofundus sp.]
MSLKHFLLTKESTEIGDSVLKQVSKHLKQTIRDSDTVGRYGGDEFVVLLHEINSATDATLVAKQIIKLIAADYIIDNITAHIGCSIGIAIYNNEPITAQQFINQADAAMYDIKKAGKNNYKLTGT